MTYTCMSTLYVQSLLVRQLNYCRQYILILINSFACFVCLAKSNFVNALLLLCVYVCMCVCVSVCAKAAKEV